MKINEIKSFLENEWFTLENNQKQYDYFFDDMERKLGYNFSEFGLAIKILMANYKGLSDFFILTNYLSISIIVEINKIQQVFSYSEFRPYLEKALKFKAQFRMSWEEQQDKFVQSKLAVYDTFLQTENWKMKFSLENIDNKIKQTFKEVYELNNKDNETLNIKVRDKLLQFWTSINRALLSLYDWKDYPVPLSLWFSLNEKGRTESLDYRIQADPVVNFHWLRNWTYRLLASKIVELDNLWYDEYAPIYKESIWSQKLHIWCWTTNSWKSTSIISVLDYIYKTKQAVWQEYKIYTTEDPIEKKLDFAYQLQVDYHNPNEDRRITFSDGIKSAMRNSPKVITVWEIRDLDTWIEALNASISWHITISTIHTNTSFSIFQRLKNLQWSVGWSWISTNDILTWLWTVTTTNLLTTYPMEKTITLKELVRPIELENWKKTYLYYKYFWKKKDKLTWKIISDKPIIDDFFYALIEYLKNKKQNWTPEIKWNYPMLMKLFNTFKRFSNFYKNNLYLDYWNKLDVFDDFIKWFEYTIENMRIVYLPVDYTETSMKPTMEVLSLTTDHINILQTAKNETEIYNWLDKNETMFLPRFYFAYVKNHKLVEEKWKTFDFLDIVNLANIGYVFRV